MNSYIAYLDVLGTKNSSENEDFDEYIKLITCFQNALIRSSHLLDETGKIYFFSDCAYIESCNINSLIDMLSSIRQTLFDDEKFVRGAVVKGKLGALNSDDIEDCEKRYADDPDLLHKMKASLNFFKQSKDNSKIKGTLFFCKDVAKAYTFESQLKGAAFYIDNEIRKETKDIVKSGFVSNIQKNTYNSFYDIKYNSESITSSFIEKVLRFYALSNTSDVKYGRYYLTILISCINSEDFSNIKYDEEKRKFVDSPEIFYKILNLKKSHKLVYNNAKGLEYLYFALIDKFYSDVKDMTLRRYFLNEVFLNYRFLSKYQNKISQLPKELISNRTKKSLLEDIVEITLAHSNTI